MSQKNIELNELAVEIYNLILKLETKSINLMTSGALTLNEVHTLKSIYENHNKSMSEIATKLGIKISTLTVTVVRLEKKGFLMRRRSDNDRRTVLIELTDKGHIAVRAHNYFHEKFVDCATEGLDEKKIDTLLIVLKKILNFLKDKNRIKEFKFQCMDFKKQK